MSAAAAEGNVDPEAVALENEHCAAFIARDFTRLDALWADDLLVNSPINRVHDKGTVLDLLRRGVIAHHSIAIHVEIARRAADLLTVMGSDTVVDTPGSPEVKRRFTNVWRRENGTWRMFLRHANIAPDLSAVRR